MKRWSGRDPPVPGRCPRCVLRLEACVCAAIVPIEARLPVLILRHAAEVRRPSNTGRAVALALTSAQLFDHGLQGGDDDPFAGLAGAAVLWPGGAPLAEPPGALVVLDGSWTQARHMLHHLPALHALPKVALPAPPDAPARMPALRERPHPAAVSTIEAVAAALEALGEPTPAAALLTLHRRLVAAQTRPASAAPTTAAR